MKPLLEVNLVEELQEAIDIHGHPLQHIRTRLDIESPQIDTSQNIAYTKPIKPYIVHCYTIIITLRQNPSHVISYYRYL
jgi:hypothetical protein